ncbi:unnamed protein product [Rangifer tarandus platyrhynchus]|uniref:Uncharacterized protein n=1 Tax=Rangifer tarandus platyrhynchus TaxID=3082113 RepID=A0ABN8XR00_RANTA|nr:unnamed protein product [Rangifer tarandus platyrhynchus]
MACLYGLGVGQVLWMLRGKISSRPVCCCHLVAKEDKTCSFCPLGQSGVWLKVNGSSNPIANLLKQHCSAKEAASAGEEPPPFPPAAALLLCYLLTSFPFGQAFCFFSFWHSYLHPNPVAPRREAKVCWPLTMHCELFKALTCVNSLNSHKSSIRQTPLSSFCRQGN